MKHMTWGHWILAAGLAALPLYGCDDGGDGTPTPDVDMGQGGMGGEGGAGGMGGAGGAGGMGGMGGAGGGEPGECGASTVIDFAATASEAGGVWTLTGRTDAADNNSGSCGGEDAGADVVVKFQAPAAGLWVFTTAGTDFDTLLYGLRDCRSGFTEVACNDNASAEDPTSRISAQLNAGDTLYLVVDAFSGLAANDFTLTAQAVDASPPSIDEVRLGLDRLRGGLGVQVVGGDPDNDVAVIRITFLDASGGALTELPLAVDDPEFADVVTFSQADGMFSFTLQGYFNPDLIELTAAVQVVAVDGFDLESAPVTAEVSAPAANPRGAACDEILQGCEAADACVFSERGAGSCAEANAPTILAAEAFVNAELGLIGLVVELSDPEANPLYLRVLPLDAAGDPINITREDDPSPVATGFSTLVPSAGEDPPAGDPRFMGRAAVFNVRFDVCLAPAQALFDECAMAGNDENTCIERANALLLQCSIERVADVAAVRVWAGDETLKESADFFLVEAVSPTPAVEAEALCDVDRATALCAEESACYSFEPATVAPTCGPIVTECPEFWGAVDLNAHPEGNGFLYTGDSSEAVNRIGEGSCGGGGPQDVLAFVAPRAGTWQFVTGGNEGDTLIFARSHCAMPGADFELACNDDIDTPDGNYNSIVRVELAEGEATYVFVDGYQGGFAGPYTLQVTQSN